MPAPQKIHDLIAQFERNRSDYRAVNYNETETRREFIDPFFKALGWDVDNQQGYSEAYKEVVHETAVKVQGKTKAPDYAFRIGGQAKFFVEAKKPSVNIKDDIHPAYQLRSYAWSGKLPLSILTDFEEFAVYDCRPRPVKSDKAAHSRVIYFTYDQYIEKWDEIAAIFSPEAIRRGSFDKYVQSNKLKRGTAEVDDAFLADISGWRELLARNIALRNEIKPRELNFAVQRIIDRLIFLRIAEDRGIEPYGRLRNAATADPVYPELCRLFRLADQKYNSGLFHFQAEKGREGRDTWTLGLQIDDKPLQTIVKNLYYPDTPFQFDMIPADILGQVYEQFLGKVIRLTAGGRAKIEDKPEVKKAGGVFYTPTYIVEYIVAQTVGKLLETRKPGPKGSAAQLAILDPACGSGSFLIGAYQYLLDWHLEQYKQKPERWAKGRNPAIFQSGDDWRLTIGERKRILLANIYGVDIDPQAVEVTKLSLLLKVLEGETEAVLKPRLLAERVLPDLSGNIQCGNSLIGPDFYAGRQLSLGLLDEEEMYRINVFDWEAAFPNIVGWGGFDAVIGNPPYVRQETLGEFKSYFKKHYKTYAGTADLYVYFVEKGIGLLKKDGRFAYIMANKWIRAKYGKPLRKWLKQENIDQLIDFGDLPVFQSATTYPCIVSVNKSKPINYFSVTKPDTLQFSNLAEYVDDNEYDVNLPALNDDGWALVDEPTRLLLLKLLQVGKSLGETLDHKLYYGIKTGLNKAFVIDAETKDDLVAKDSRSTELIKPFLAGRDIKRYQTPNATRFLILIPSGWTNAQTDTTNKWEWLQNNYPAVSEHLAQYAEAAQKRSDMGDYWWELRSCAYYEEFEKPKLMLPDISLHGNFLLDSGNNFYCVNTAYILGTSDLYLLGILNSKLIAFLYGHMSPAYRGGYLRFIYQYLVQLPIPVLNEPEQRKQLTGLVEQMLDLHKRLATARLPQEKTLLQRQIAAADRQIDQLVYQLYTLTPAEIAIVEGLRLQKS